MRVVSLLIFMSFNTPKRSNTLFCPPASSLKGKVESKSKIKDPLKIYVLAIYF